MTDTRENVPRAVSEVLDATGLVYGSDAAPGYRRHGEAAVFRWVDVRGRPSGDARRRRLRRGRLSADECRTLAGARWRRA